MKRSPQDRGSVVVKTSRLLRITHVHRAPRQINFRERLHFVLDAPRRICTAYACVTFVSKYRSCFVSNESGARWPVPYTDRNVLRTLGEACVSAVSARGVSAHYCESVKPIWRVNRRRRTVCVVNNAR